MNRKIFTLLAGTFLMFAVVFNASAQSVISKMPLQLGEPVTKLKLGANEFYHLVVTGVSDGSGNPAPAAAIKLDPDNQAPLVLYMGKYQSTYAPDPTVRPAGTYPIFLEGLGYAGQPTGKFQNVYDPHWQLYYPSGSSYAWSAIDWFKPNAPKSQESASSLWCTVVSDYDQGRNITFDFTNKQIQNQLLEVNVNGYENWKDYLTSDSRHTSGVNNYLPGNVSGWKFSNTYANSVESNMPLYSYITADTVAVLCVHSAAELDYVYVKIASVTDVVNNKVAGMIYFTLYNAAPFALSAEDFNTMLGSKNPNPNPSVKLVFDPDVSPNTMPNPFTKTGLVAAELGSDDPATVSSDFRLIRSWYPGTTPVTAQYEQGTDSPIDPGNVAGSWNGSTVNTVAGFDLLGYIYLKRASDNFYLYVDSVYENGNLGGDRYLTFNYRKSLYTQGAVYNTNSGINRFINVHPDEALWGQTIWRLIYYPSGDSIYINPYQATYLPTDDQQMMKRATTGANPGTKINFTDAIALSDQGYYTFRARPLQLVPPTVPSFVAGTSGFTVTQYNQMVGRLQKGKNPGLVPGGALGVNVPDFYTFWHRNYVTIQDLTGSAVKIATLYYNGTAAANDKINTHITFNGVYTPCSGTDNSGRTTVAQDLYLIRNELGQYLYVPLYSATDSAEWVTLEPSVHPELLPSFQWIVLKQNANSANSYITLTNREFDGLVYGPIQVWNKSRDNFDLVGKNFNWNNKPVNGNVVDFDKLTKLDKSTFVKLGKVYKNDKYMGYQFISGDTSRLNVYALNFGSGIDPNVYVSWNGKYEKYPNTDTTVYVYGQQNGVETLYFKLDTVSTYPLENYGWVPAKSGAKEYIADLVQLVRQPYQLNYDDRFKFLCSDSLNMRNGSQSEYAMSKSKSGITWNLQDMIGTPVFNLRNFYHKDINGDGKLEVYNALVQRVDRGSTNTIAAQATAFKNYLTAQYGATAAGTVIDILNGGDPDRWFKTGVMVAQFDDQTSKLKAQLRADNVTRVSTFRLERDDDPIYRRFNVAKYDGANNDAPKVLDFYSIDYENYKLFENTGQWESQKRYWDYSGALGAIQPIGQKNYLGYVHTLQYPDAVTALYVDTAYINRKGGDVKPQYMLVVNPTGPEGKDACDEFGNPIPQDNNIYLRGRYLINATDSARGVAPDKDHNQVQYNSIRVVVDPKTGDEIPEYSGWNYLWDTNWERLVFVDAVHVYGKDALYFANWPGVTLDQYTNTLGVIDTAKLDKASAPKGTATTATKPIRKVYLGDNLHKDVVFSMRLMFRGNNDFMIESETGNGIKTNTPDKPNENTNRIWGISYGQLNSNGPVWAPCQGGWVKIQNQVPVISRSDQVWQTPQGLGFNTQMTTAQPTSNDKVAVAAVTVIGGKDAVTILNAAGKKVVVSNILGQTVASTVLTSDNVTLAAPAGVVVVAVEGSAPVKALVK